MKNLVNIIVVSVLMGAFCEVGTQLTRKALDRIEVTKEKDAKIIKISSK